VLWIWKYIIII